MKRKAKFLGVGAAALLMIASAAAQAAYPGDVTPAGAAPALSIRSATASKIAGQLVQDARAYADFLILPAASGQQSAQAQNVPLSVVLRNIRSRYPGKHLDTRLAGNKYKVIWLTPDGRRLDILADARTGNIISVRGD